AAAPAAPAAPGSSSRRRRARRATAGSPGGRCQANETSHFTELLEHLDLDGAVVTFDALHTVRANLDWLAGEKKAHYIAVVKRISRCCMPGSGPCPGGRYRPAALPATPGTAGSRPGP